METNVIAFPATVVTQADIPEIVKQYPHLRRTNNNESRYVTAAKNIRNELAAAFPGIKFRVKTRSYAGGNSIDIEWTDGPTTRQVDKIVDRYSSGYFDGSQDLYEYTRSDFTTHFGDSKYVMPSRRYSDELAAKILAEVWDQYFGKDVPAPDVKEWRTGRLYAKTFNGFSMDPIINTAFSTWDAVNNVHVDPYK